MELWNKSFCIAVCGFHGALEQLGPCSICIAVCGFHGALEQELLHSCMVSRELWNQSFCIAVCDFHGALEQELLHSCMWFPWSFGTRASLGPCSRCVLQNIKGSRLCETVDHKSGSDLWTVYCNSGSDLGIVYCNSGSDLWIVYCNSGSDLWIIYCNSGSDLGIVYCNSGSDLWIVYCNSGSDLCCDLIDFLTSVEPSVNVVGGFLCRKCDVCVSCSSVGKMNIIIEMCFLLTSLTSSSTTHATNFFT